MIIADLTLLKTFTHPAAYVIVMTLAAIGLYALEEMAAEIEDPFGDDLNDLATEVFEKGLRRDGIPHHDTPSLSSRHCGPLSGLVQGCLC